MEILIPLVVVSAVVAAAVMLRRRRPSPDDVTVRQLDDIVAKNSRSASGTLGSTRATLAVINEIGGDTSAETDITFYLDIPDRIDAGHVMDLVASKGVRVRLSDVGAPPYAVILTTRMVPSELAIEDWIGRLDTIAAAYGGKVDGWEAATPP